MLNRGVIMSDDSKTRARIRALLALAHQAVTSALVDLHDALIALETI